MADMTTPDSRQPANILPLIGSRQAPSAMLAEGTTAKEARMRAQLLLDA